MKKLFFLTLTSILSIQLSNAASPEYLEACIPPEISVKLMDKLLPKVDQYNRNAVDTLSRLAEVYNENESVTLIWPTSDANRSGDRTKDYLYKSSLICRHSAPNVTDCKLTETYAIRAFWDGEIKVRNSISLLDGISGILFDLLPVKVTDGNGLFGKKTYKNIYCYMSMWATSHCTIYDAILKN